MKPSDPNKPSLQTSSQLEYSDSESSRRRDKERREQEKRHKREKDKEEKLREALVDIEISETETFTLLSLYFLQTLIKNLGLQDMFQGN